MGTQIITIGAGGEISGLQRKKGQGLNLQELGHAKTERVSEIVFDENAQSWFVQPIRGPFAGNPLTAKLWAEEFGLCVMDVIDGISRPVGCRMLSAISDHAVPGGRLYFDDYDDAVNAEVEFLDAARRRGIF
jgi:hypothetical protein